MQLARTSRWLMLALLICLIPIPSFAGVFISVNFAPPVLPVYEQPICPEPNLMWTPGYWAYGDDGYYWVPGAWVPAPYVGALWTPGYWGWSNSLYVWHVGYWGPHIGYYGGVNYGFGYGGIGFAGGEWRGGAFAYNTAVVHVNETIIHTTYVDRTIVERNTVVANSHVAFSGGPGGINHPPSSQEQAAMHEAHVAPTSAQVQHESTFRADHTAYAKSNGGRPQNVAISRPLAGTTAAHPMNGGARGSAQPAEAGRVNANGNANVNARPAQNSTPSRTYTPQQRTYTPQPSNERPINERPTNERPSMAPRSPQQAPAARPEAAPRAPAPSNRGEERPKEEKREK